MFVRPATLVLSCLCLAAGALKGQERAYAPIPDAARGPEIPQDKGYLVEEVRDGLYWVTEGAYTHMFLTTGEGVIVVDAPPTIGEKILAAIAEVTDEPITHVIYSHTHADHIGAAHLYPQDATYIAHAETAAQLRDAMNPDRSSPYGVFAGGGAVPVPTITFDDRYTLQVGDQILELDYRGVNHEPGNIFIYAPRQKVLMLADVIFPGWVPFKNLAMSEDALGWLEAHDQVLSYDFDTFVGGHMNRLGTREDAEIQREYMHDVWANAASALQSVDFYAIAQETGFENPWLLFDRYLDTVAKTCEAGTLEKWRGRLGAVDVFTEDQCFMAIMSLRID